MTTFRAGLLQGLCLAFAPLYVLLFVVLTAGYGLAVLFVGLREWGQGR